MGQIDIFGTNIFICPNIPWSVPGQIYFDIHTLMYSDIHSSNIYDSDYIWIVIVSQMVQMFIYGSKWGNMG